MSSDATFSHKNAGDIDNERLEKVGPIDLPFKLKKDALRVNSDHVQSVYNDIAPHFNQTRTYIWPKVKEYIESLPPWSVVLDVGCGNGRNMNLRKTDLFFVGLDISTKLLHFVGRDKKICTVAAVQQNLPLNSNSVDSILSIAVVHHLVDPLQRQKSIFEIERCLRVGGTALIYVWTKEQKKFEGLSSDVLIPWQLQKKYDQRNEQFQPLSKKRKTNLTQDAGVVKNNGISKTLWRYYHLFEENELENLVKHAQSLKIIEAGRQYHNWYVVVQKQYITNKNGTHCCLD